MWIYLNLPILILSILFAVCIGNDTSTNSSLDALPSNKEIVENIKDQILNNINQGRNNTTVPSVKAVLDLEDLKKENSKNGTVGLDSDKANVDVHSNPNGQGSKLKVETNKNDTTDSLSTLKIDEILSSNLSKGSDIKPQLKNDSTQWTDGKSLPPASESEDSTKPYGKKVVVPFSTDAMFRGLFVFMAIAFIIICYLGIKYIRIRRRRSHRRYKMIARGDDREPFFPVSDDEEGEEEIFNANAKRDYS